MIHRKGGGPLNDERTIQAIAARDERAIRRVMDQYSRLLWSVAGGVLQGVGTEEDLEECVADVYVFLWMHPEKFDPLRGSLKSYLAMVARSRALNRRRQLTRQDAAAILMRTGQYLGKTETGGTTVTFTDRDAIAGYAQEAVDYVSALGVMNGTSADTFSPLGSYTRQQAYLTVCRLYEALQS